MLPSQQTTKQISALRAKVNQIPELRSDDAEFATKQGERAALVGQLIDLDLLLVGQMDREDQEAQAAMSRSANHDGWTPELREFHELGQRTSMVEYMQAGLQQRHLRPDTPEHEYNSHVFGGNWNVGDYPLEMLAGPGGVLQHGGSPCRAGPGAGAGAEDGDYRHRWDGREPELR